MDPSSRYEILTDSQRIKILTAKVGDMVKIICRDGFKYNGKSGIIQYIGPVSNETNLSKQENLTWANRLQNTSHLDSAKNFNQCVGSWFGVEIVVSIVVMVHSFHLMDKYLLPFSEVTDVINIYFAFRTENHVATVMEDFLIHAIFQLHQKARFSQQLNIYYPFLK